MRIRIGDPALLPELLQFLDERVDFVSAAASDVEVDIGVLGSFKDGGRAELDSQLELWHAAHPRSTVEFVSAPAQARVLKLRLRRAVGLRAPGPRDGAASTLPTLDTA